MSKVNDLLGDEIKAYESLTSHRAGIIGQPIVIRVDGASFSKFTKNSEKPYDARLSQAMMYATETIVDKFNCCVGYTQSDESSFLLYDENHELPYGGRFEKLSSRFAAFFSVYFLQKGLELFPELIGKDLPSFDGRAVVFPNLDLAAKSILWREIDARRNSVSCATAQFFKPNELNGKSSADQREMLSQKGVDFYSYPEVFRRGAFFQRRKVLTYLTEEEMSRIPEKHRPKGPVERSRVTQIQLPNLSLIDNLADVLVYGKEPIVVERKFALTVTG